MEMKKKEKKILIKDINRKRESLIKRKASSILKTQDRGLLAIAKKKKKKKKSSITKNPD